MVQTSYIGNRVNKNFPISQTEEIVVVIKSSNSFWLRFINWRKQMLRQEQIGSGWIIFAIAFWLVYMGAQLGNACTQGLTSTEELQSMPLLAAMAALAAVKPMTTLRVVLPVIGINSVIGFGNGMLSMPVFAAFATSVISLILSLLMIASQQKEHKFRDALLCLSIAVLLTPIHIAVRMIDLRLIKQIERASADAPAESHIRPA